MKLELAEGLEEKGRDAWQRKGKKGSWKRQNDKRRVRNGGRKRKELDPVTKFLS